MKFVAGDLLKTTLGGILKLILLNKVSCEALLPLARSWIPLRLQEGDGEEEKVSTP